MKFIEYSQREIKDKSILKKLRPLVMLKLGKYRNGSNLRYYEFALFTEDMGNYKIRYDTLNNSFEARVYTPFNPYL